MDNLQNALFQFCLRQGDTHLILGHRLSEMCSRGPTLEEDIALTNLALDHIGQAEAFLRLAAETEGRGRTEDDLSYLRSVDEFCNAVLAEQPNTDFAYVVARQFFLDVYQCLLYQRLQNSSDPTLAGMGARFLKEVVYHQRHSAAWVERLGQGTTESHRRIQTAVNELWRYTPELLSTQPWEAALIEKGFIPDTREIALEWTVQVIRVFSRAGLRRPEDPPTASYAGHSDHLAHILAEMQYLPRTYPDAKW
ncbi:MAG: 1,2-phenylacetyl-CoA epoxidase subunit PaaC [Saprospiraceae bacterium]|nr:1,2-phenylacetyl-CoA epoxidase subunit PaaC [Saprospiraceae bacterium]